MGSKREKIRDLSALEPILRCLCVTPINKEIEMEKNMRLIKFDKRFFSVTIESESIMVDLKLPESINELVMRLETKQ